MGYCNNSTIGWVDFSQSWGLEGEIRVPSRLGPGKGPLPGSRLQTSPPILTRWRAERGKSLFRDSYKATDPIMGPRPCGPF